MASSEIRTELRLTGAGEVCRSVLDELPLWFGIPEANDDYVQHAQDHPTVVAYRGVDTTKRNVLGLLTLVNHSPEASEIYLIAVRPTAHRTGVGAAMLGHAERHLRVQGVRFLQVKTLAPMANDPNYLETLKFYHGTGFTELEVFPTLWDPANPALQLIKYLGDG